MSLNYSNYQLDEILRLEDPKRLFSLLTELDWKEHKAHWSDIFKGLAFYYKNKEYLDEQLPKHLTDKHIKLLEDKFGFDVNFIDGFGNNLLLYAANIIDLSNGFNSEKFYFDYAIDYIKSKTSNIYLVNNCNENLLFAFTSFNSAGTKGEKLVKLLKDYPDFDLTLINNYGNNLLTNALIKRAPAGAIRLFVNLGVSPLQINKNNLSVLNFICYGFADDIYKEVFNSVIKSLDNPFIKNNQNESFLDVLIKHNKEVLPDWQLGTWLALSLDNIAKDNYKLNKETKTYLEHFFNSNHNIQLQVLLDKAKSSFEKRVLEEELINKETTINLHRRYKV